MLVLTRKQDEKVIIDGDICITVLEIRGNHARLGITAPVETPIWRQELWSSSVGPNPIDTSGAGHPWRAGPEEKRG
jgi:carbon storage regulator